MNNKKKGLELNKVYKWEQIVKEYPDMYAFISDIKRKNGEIEECRLLDICKFGETHIYTKKYINSKVRFSCQRTTDKLTDIGVMF